MVPPMSTLQLFVEVAQCRSFSEAARLLDMTQPAASQKIAALEHKLGVNLLDRSVRPLALTDAGKHYLSGCQHILDFYANMKHEIKAFQNGSRGQVHVAAIYSSGIELLGQFRDQFAKENPYIDVDIRYEKPDKVYNAVVDQECDLGIVSYPQRWHGVGVMPFRQEIMAVVCNPNHTIALMKSIEASALSDYKMVNFDDDLPVSRHVRRYLAKHNSYPEVKHTFDNIDTIKNVVSVTDQFAILPQRTVLREVEAGTLSAVELIPKLTRPLGIIFRRPLRDRNGMFPPAVQAFVDYLPRENDVPQTPLWPLNVAAV